MTDTPMGGASVSEVLAAAADLLEKPGAWTQGVFARRENGRNAGPTYDDAVCFCAVGAVMRVVGGSRSPAYYDAFNRLNAMARRKHFMHVAMWNDAPERTQAEVVTALRQAARQASNPTAEGV